MANNTTLPGTGDVIADEDIAGVKYQKMKLVDGTAGNTGMIAGTAAYGLQVDTTRLPWGVQDTFGKVQTVNANNDIDVQFYRDAPANLVTITAAGTPNGTAVTTTGLMQLATGVGVTAEIKAVTLDVVTYRAGGEIYAMFTAAWLTGAVATSAQRIGLYDTSNGMFIGWENSTFGTTIRQNGVDTQTARASWNVDLLTGAAGSKFTRAGTPEAIDLTKLNLFRIRFGWLGAAPIKFEVASPDGEWVLFHIVRQPNLSATPHIYNPDLPITAHLVKTAGATNIRFNTACWGAGSTYDKIRMTNADTLGTVVNNVALLPAAGLGSVTVRVGTSTTGTIIFEGSVNGTDWITHSSCYLVGAAGSPDTPVTAAVTPTLGNVYRMQALGYRMVRIRTATTLGATVILQSMSETASTFVNVGNAYEQGNVAHAIADAGNPVKIGYKAIAHGTNPTAVAAAQRTDAYANRAGIPFVIGGHPNIITVTLNITTAQTDAAINSMSIGAGLKCVCTGFQFTVDNASTVFPKILLGFGATNTPTTVGVIGAHGGVPAGGGFGRGDGTGILGVGADGEELRVTTVGTIGGNGGYLTVSYFTIES